MRRSTSDRLGFNATTPTGAHLGQIRLKIGDNESLHFLSGSTLIGRHPNCDIHLADAHAPLVWLEIRYRQSQWDWRVLGGADQTRGSGANLARGWRALSGQGARSRVSLADVGHLELSCEKAPVRMVRDLNNGQCVTGAALDELLEQVNGLTFALDENAHARNPLLPGESFAHNGRVYRLSGPPLPGDTENKSFSITHPDCCVDIDLENLCATFTLGQSECKITGECIRVLAVYGEFQADQAPSECPWLNRSEVYERWLGLGGNPNSPIVRMGWERGKVRTLLSRAGAGDVGRLFESRRRGGQAETRLRVRVG